ncbi:putative electron transport protein YccM [Rubripirellula obstinata]|uniref:Putative electron transport protein YccM n=1 Tax=Rubripirellula obstinata TaxID=406547 RepID=A0A5B1CHB6_9BACT|nr:cytochrome c oxidase accessory protein CcoG [Rubripirellula obstinata]KAA1258913.1 putative electron transport protein YccM [Rubripirellula obstinata]
MSESNDALLETPEHVLSTLDGDGSRRWINPKLSTGTWWKRRRVVAYALMIVFVVIPHIRINGKPAILLDIAARKFTVLGKTFLPTDTILLALLMLSVFFTIVLVTAITGRAWCGWACPQTVYMEFLFRPIDRFFGGTKGKGGKPKANRNPLMAVARIAVYVLLCMFLAHTFLAYFVGTEKLSQWVRSSPVDHPVAFLVMAGTTVAMLFDFLYFREQMCLIACPYGRFQSVMLDRQSLIVAYDPVRGEPRQKGKRKLDDDSRGDCVACNQCVVVCPTGIDIREGLQMECINCTQCIDACDDVMEKTGQPKGLIRFSSQDAIERKPARIARGRTIVYPLILSAVLGGLAYALVVKSGFDARIIRGKGAPFTMAASGDVRNSFSVRLVNREDEPKSFQLAIDSSSLTGASLNGVSADAIKLKVIDPEMLELKPGQSILVPVSIDFPDSLTKDDGNEPVDVVVTDGRGQERRILVRLLGPR